MKTQKPSFAKAMAQAQHYADQLEQADMSLEDILECFEKGMVAIAQCKQQLATAEQRMQEIHDTHTQQLTES